MHQDHSQGRDRPSTSVRATAVRATAALAGVLWLTACGTPRVELCTSVQTRMLEELRTSEGSAHAVRDPWACEKNARRLRELAGELHNLESRDPTLRLAVEGYSAHVESLADAYARLAEAYQHSAELSPTAAGSVQAVLSRGVLEHADALTAPRVQLQNACNGL